SAQLNRWRATARVISVLLHATELTLEQACCLLDEALAFQVHNRQELDSFTGDVLLNPYIEQSLPKKTEDTSLIGAVGFEGNTLLRFEQDREQPRAISMKV